MPASPSDKSVLGKHLSVLNCFSAMHPFLSLSEIARGAELPVSTAHRLVEALVHEGLLERLPDRTYRLGVRLWELASRTPGAVGLREAARPWLNRVQSELRQHTQLSVLNGLDALFIERLSAREAVVNATIIGGRIPLPLSSSGIVLLAFAGPELIARVVAVGWPRHTEHTIADADELEHRLDRARNDGFAVLDGHIYEESRGIAVPIRNSHGAVHAALSVVVPNDDSSPRPAIELLQAASAAIAKALEHAHHSGSTSGHDPEPLLLSSSLRSLEYLKARRSTDLGVTEHPD